MFFKKSKIEGEPKPKMALWKRILKWTGISFLIMLIMIILLPFLFEKQIFNMIKDEIENNLYADLECEDYSLTLLSTFPNFTMRLDNFKLTGQKEFKGIPLIDVKEIVITFDLTSVLFGDTYDIKDITLKSPKINVQVLKNGKANYDIAKPSEEKEEPEEPSKFAATIRSYSIVDGNIIYNDLAGDMYMNLKNLNHTGNGDFTQDLFVLETQTTAQEITFEYGGVAYLKNTKSEMTVNVEMDMNKMRFTFKDNDASLNELPIKFDGFVEVSNEILMDLNFKTTKSDFKHLMSLVPAVYTPDFGEYKFSGKMGIDGRVFGKYSDKEMPSMDFTIDVDNGYFKYPDLPKAIQGIYVKANIKSKGDPSMDDMVIDVSKFNADFGGNKIAAFFRMTNPMTDPGIGAGLDAKINMATMKDFMPMNPGESYTGIINSDIRVAGRMSALEREDYDKFTAKGKVLAESIEWKTKDSPDMLVKKAELQFNPQSVELPVFEILYGKTEMSANGKIDNLLHYLINGDALKGNFNFSSPLIDMKELMPSSTEASAKVDATASANSTSTDESTGVFEVPTNLNVSLTTSIGKLIYPNSEGKPDIELDNISGEIKMADGEMSLNQLKFRTLDADIAMNGKYSTKDPKKPVVDFNYDIRNMDIKKASSTFNTIDKFTPIASKCTGKFSSNFDLTMSLNEKMEPDYNSMTGSGNIQTKNIYVEGFEPLNKLAEKLKLSKLSKQNVSDLSITFKIKDGRYWLDKTNMKVGNYPTEIEGSTGIDQTIDYRTTFSIPRSEFGAQANDVLNSLMDKAKKSGVEVNLGDVVNVTAFIKGTVKDPKIETNLKEVADNVKDDIKDAVKEKVEEKIEEVKEDVKEKASAEAEKIMKDAEEKAAQILAEAKRNADIIRAESKKAAATIRANAEKEGQKLMTEAGSNPVKKIAAQKLVDSANKKADAEAKKVEDDGEAKAKKLEDEADKKADAVLKEGREQADKLK
jgi:hypothetical protein